MIIATTDEERRTRRFLAAKRKEREAIEARLKQSRAEEKAARAKVDAVTVRSETWHRMALAHEQRQVGFGGEHAVALAGLQLRPAEQYWEILKPYRDENPTWTVLQCEYEAVIAALDPLTKRGTAIHLKRAQKKYAQDCERFADWQKLNPGKKDWRELPATKEQRFLIEAMADVDDPVLLAQLSRGAAFDWLEARGGNPRLAARDTAAASPAPAPAPAPAPQNGASDQTPTTARSLDSGVDHRISPLGEQK